MIRTKRIIIGMVMLIFVIGVIGPSSHAQVVQKDKEDGSYCKMSNEELHKVCRDTQQMQGLTPEQRKEIDREWQRRVPEMTPEERQMYCPEGNCYYTGS